jgi:hypothetical protein
VHGWRFGIYIDWDGDTTSYDLHRVSFYIVFVKYINRREKSIQNKVLLIYSIQTCPRYVPVRTGGLVGI